MSVRPLRQILAWQSVLVTVIPFAGVVLLGGLWLFPQIEVELKERQREVAAAIAVQVESYLSLAVHAIKAGASIPAGEEVQHLQRLLDAQIDASESLSAMYVVDGSGRVAVAGVSQRNNARRQELQRLDLSRNKLFREAMRSRQLSWSDTFLSVIGGGVSVACAIPSGGKAIIGEIRLSGLVDYLKKIRSAGDSLIQVLDSDGQVIADRHGRYTAQQFNISNIPLVRKAMSGGPDGTELFSFEGQAMVGSISSIPGIHWHVLVAQPLRTAYHTTMVTAGIAGGGLLMAAILGAVAAIFLSRRMSVRFEELAASARSIASGGDPGSWPSSGVLEVKELARDLELMAVTLKERELSLQRRIVDYEESQAKLSLEVVERRRAEGQLERLNAELEERVKDRTGQLEAANASLAVARDVADAANRAKSMFLANMSHEIRTPMNAVLGFAQLLERDQTLTPKARDQVATIMKCGDHLLAIINDILEMSRIEAGKVELHAQAVDLHILLDDLAVMFRMRGEQKGLVLTLEISSDLPRYIVVDLGKLRQVLINLLGNAIKFTKAGSVELRAFPSGHDRIAIEVKDTGIGISTEDQAKLFRPFERAKSVEQEAGGTGLGLAISREYAHLMDGDISVVSTVGAGSCFRFSFAAPVTVMASPSSEVSRLVTGLVPGQGEIRVLVVDDKRVNRELLRGILEPIGVVVDEACDGSEAVDKALALKPRAVLMDLVMPGMDGGEASRILRDTYSKEVLPIIGITASVLDESTHLFKAAGLNAYIAKPFREQELFAALACHAGIRFETEEPEETLVVQSVRELPTLDRMPVDWREAFHEAIVRRNITRIRRLGEDARKADAELAAWILEHAGRYDLEALKRVDGGR